ncbi:hypothetical protein [Phreatobacter stygius]|uniref:Recombinase domain-containing protein n=1 Tax=Phreatobacter stygius TaxID=1940610 RepID=A0A4D7B6B8_9HYPH|nr:hypothetical protein [Phreatobacter stygius]QCI65740.1 hypothetical protein E8M01_16895 [Phreatobacter stygius]
MTGPRKPGCDEQLVWQDIFSAFVEATLPLIRDHLARGVGHHGMIANLLNARGIPCFGHARWTATDIRMVLSHGASREPG